MDWTLNKDSERQGIAGGGKTAASSGVSGAPLVKLEHVSRSYQIGEVETHVLIDTSFEALPGEFVVVLGVSGCGKTTLLNLIGALDTPSSGTIIVDEEEISAASEDACTRFRRHKVGFIFQFFNLIPTLTAAENVEAALEILDLSKEEIIRRTQHVLSEVWLADKADHFPSQLSGGEQQRVAIARALAKKPMLILADEPTGNLDETTGEKIMTLMKKLNRETGTCFVVVSHDQKMAKLADRLVRIHEGRIVQ